MQKHHFDNLLVNVALIRKLGARKGLYISYLTERSIERNDYLPDKFREHIKYVLGYNEKVEERLFQDLLKENIILEVDTRYTVNNYLLEQFILEDTNV